MRKNLSIDGRLISEDSPPYVIAEMSANHNGSLETAIGIISAAARCGADAIKLQTYTADTLTIDSDAPDFQITEGLWAGKTLYELYELAHTPWEWHAQLFKHARHEKITIFSSPFDDAAVDLLEDLGAPAYKIASFEAVDLELIKYTASTKKPLIISTGMANFEEIREAVEVALDHGSGEVGLLHCVSGYPAPPDNYNLKTIPDMIERFGCVVGISDHTLDDTTTLAAITLGARIVEKHFTLNKDNGGPDDSFSMNPDDLMRLVTSCSTAWSALGQINYGLKPSESDSTKFRRSLYFVKDLKQGDVIKSSDVRSIRPGYGLAPRHLPFIIGKRVSRDVSFGYPVTKSDIVA